MARINPKLNLNKTPQNVEDSSLIFAKNIKLNKDLSVSADTSIDSIEHWEGENNSYPNVVGKIVGVNTKVYFFTDENNGTIYEYDELTNTTKKVKCGWTYHNGKITGCVTVNNTGEEILTIAESDGTEDVPIKHINLAQCNENDEESVYTQTANIPITNLEFANYYPQVIPNGVYQFFIRYKIRDEFYTDWFPASKELFTGNINRISTIQGELQYTKTDRDSDKSFVLNVVHLYEEYTKIYTDIQIGYILSNDNGVFARSWKTVPIDTNEIYFSYDSADIQEINIDDLLKTTYEISNVKNIISYKNKLYIANYNETDFNEDLTEFSKKINIRILGKTIVDESLTSYFIQNKELLPKNPQDNIYTHLNKQLIGNAIYGKSNYCNTSIEGDVENNIIKNKNNQYITTPYIVTIDKVVTESVYPPRPVDTHRASNFCLWLGIYVKVNNEYKRIKGFNDYTQTAFRWYDDDIMFSNYLCNSDNATEKNIIDACDSLLIKNHVIKGVDINGNFYIELEELDNNNNHKVVAANEYYLVYSKSVKSEERYYFVDHGLRKYWYWAYSATKTTSIIKRNCSLNLSLIKSSNTNNDVLGLNTLLPYTEYKFYAHYIKQNGIITNGNFIKSIFINNYNCYYESITKEEYDSVEIGKVDVKVLPNYTGSIPKTVYYRLVDNVENPTIIYGYYHLFMESVTNPHILYPAFSNILKPNGYKGVFISIIKSKNDVARCFNHQLYDKDNNFITEITRIGTYTHKIDCIEVDSLLYNLNDNITVYNDIGEIITTDAKYISSGNSDKDNFGTAGFISWDEVIKDEVIKNGDIQAAGGSIQFEGKNCWIVVNKNLESTEIENLIKLTPYIKTEDHDVEYSYDDYLNLNTPGYFCKVEKPQRFKQSGENDYTNKGADRYFVSGNDIFVKNYPVDGNLDLESIESRVDLLGEDFKYVLSNFNLNYLSINEVVTPQTHDYKETPNSTDLKKQIIQHINSMTSSSIYRLEAMYKSYTRKYYTESKIIKFTKFDNTVRSSNIDVDEVYRNIYKFDAEDYYNVPTNRGIIINMFTIINKIYVHCEHALFVFTDTNMMKVGENLYTSNNTEVALQQSSPFEIGIQEVLDSAYGYAGIQNKKHSLVTFNSYIFYDKLANTIYAYGGDSQITPISDSIDKLLKWFQPEDILFAADDTNNRFFINLRKVVNDNYENVCLSFNFTAKSFVSIHDMDFDESFNSRINTYFSKQIIENDTRKTKVFKISKTERDSNNFTTNYNEIKKTSALQLVEVDNLSVEGRVANSIDIVCNTNYEKTKVLNWINWICQEIINYNSNDGITLAEESVKKYSGHFLRIYSDETYSALLPLTNDENEPLMSNNVPLSVENGLYNPAIRKYPRYNCGVWSMNNFRDIKNTTKGNKAYSDDKSLLYGKYFVIRFIFKNKNFKFENIKYNMGDYEKN